MAYQSITNLVYGIALVTILNLLIISALYIYHKQQQLTKEIYFQDCLLETKFKVQEETYETIAREIHDDISLSLTLSKLNLTTYQENTNAADLHKIDHAVELLTDTIIKLNNLSKSLHSGLVYNYGLLHAIENELMQIERSSHLKIDYSLQGDVITMTAEKETMIYRIIQETLHNIIKHARATKVFLLIHYSSVSLNISIADDGRGMEQNNPCRKTFRGTGMINIKQRLSTIDGNLIIDSKKDKGTKINISIPITPKPTKI